MGDVIGFGRFRDAQEKRKDPKGYEARKALEALERQHQKLALPKPVEMIEPDWDDVPVFDRGLLWGVKDEKPGPLTLFFITQADPGDEI